MVGVEDQPHVRFALIPPDTRKLPPDWPVRLESVVTEAFTHRHQTIYTWWGLRAVLNLAQLAEKLGIPESTVAIWRSMKIGPPALLVRGRPVYLDVEVEAWLDSGGGLAYGIALPRRPLGGVADEPAHPVLTDGHGEQVGA